MTLASLTVLEAGYCQCPGGLARGYGSWRNIRFPALFALLEHPRFGRLLFDTGYSADFFHATRRLPYRLYRKATPVTLAEEQTAVSQLAARGLAPRDIDQVFISHFHPDHISALKDFPAARYRYWPDAYAAVLALDSPELHAGKYSDITAAAASRRRSPRSLASSSACHPTTTQST